MTVFDSMTVEEAVSYCYSHKEEYIRLSPGLESREFDCLISCLEDRLIHPSQLPEYGMDFEAQVTPVSPFPKPTGEKSEELLKVEKEVMENLKEAFQRGGGESSHMLADQSLCDLLRALGYNNVVDLYQGIPNMWYG